MRRVPGHSRRRATTAPQDVSREGAATFEVLAKMREDILCCMLKPDQKLRFGELRRRLPGISEKVLYEQLREMERDGVVRREAFEEAVLRVEYSLTPAGTALNDAAHVLAKWGLSHAGRDRLPAAAE